MEINTKSRDAFLIKTKSTNNYPSMCVGLIIRTLPPHLLWLGCIFFVEFIELKKCVHHFCVHYLITIDWIWKNMIKRKPPISRGLYKRELVFSSVGVERFELPTSCSQSRLKILYKLIFTSVSVVKIEPIITLQCVWGYKQKTPRMWGFKYLIRLIF